MAPAQPAIGWRQFADLMRHIGRLLSSLVRDDLDHRIPARHEQAAPIGRDLTPDLIARPLQHEGALGAMALDQVLILENAERLANGRACNPAFGGKIVHGRNLLARRPQPGLDAPPEQARQLDVAGNPGAAEVDLGPGLGPRRHLRLSFRERIRTTQAKAKPKTISYQDLRDSLLAFLPVGQGRQSQGAATAPSPRTRKCPRTRSGRSGKLMAADAISICHNGINDSHWWPGGGAR